MAKNTATPHEALTGRDLLAEGWTREDPGKPDAWTPPGWTTAVPLAEVRRLRAILLDPPAPLDAARIARAYAHGFVLRGDRWFQRGLPDDATAEHYARRLRDERTETPGLSHAVMATLMRWTDDQLALFRAIYG